MIEDFFKKFKVVRQLRENSFGASLDCLITYLSKQGFSFPAIRTSLLVVGHFNYWLKTEHISFHTINEATVNKFLYEHLKECFCPVKKGGSFRYCRPALKHFLNALRENHLVALPKKHTSTISPRDKLLDDFGKYLEKVQGIKSSTVHLYSKDIREFLKAKYRFGPIELQRLDINDIRKYVTAKATGYKLTTIRSLITSLRAFFRFLRMTKQIEYFLEDAIPIIPYKKLSTIPKYLTDEQLHYLLSSFDVSTPLGLRNQAMTLLMSRLGLRSCEVTQLKLEDIDWQEGVIQLEKTKSRRVSHLPLLKDVGEAIAAYLKKGRPQSKERYVFVAHRAPVGRRLYTSSVNWAVRRVFKLSTLSVPSFGPHVLRHTLATKLLQKGANLKEIADILRHRSIETTNIYTKVDFKALAEVALPWPEVRS